MSFLIEMQDFREQSKQQVIRHLINQQLNALIHHPEFTSIQLINPIFQNEIYINIPKGYFSFFKDTKWTIYLLKTHFRITVSFINQEGLCYVRAQSQRMKIELMIMLKMINSGLPIQQQYFVDPKTGVLYYTFNILIQDYQIKLKGNDSLRKLFKYIFFQINNYLEIILFCEPLQTRSIYQNNSQIGLDQVNRYRLLLRNTRKIRQNGMIYMKNIMKIKKKMEESPLDQNLRKQLQQTRCLFQTNIKEFQLLSVGVEQSQKNNKQLEGCVKHIYKLSQFLQSREENQKYMEKYQKDEGEQAKDKKKNKIVHGIIIYKNQQIMSLSKQGAHSEVFRGKFMYEIVQTTNKEVAMANRSKWITGKIKKTQLVIKKCNKQLIPSKNSFLNEICLLEYLRDSSSKYIGKYYLDLKPSIERSENDYIYMNPYYQNLHQLVKNCRTLSMSERLTICYKISKGLCFLGSKSVLHRDFKPQNVMIDQFFSPFIIDFGSCAPIHKSSGFTIKESRLLSTKLFHIQYHKIPEQYEYIHHKFTLDQYNFHPLFDVYSFGRTICYIFFNTIYPPNSEDISTRPYPELLKNIIFLITICLQVDPDQRPAFAQISSFLGILHNYISSLSGELANRSRSLEIPHSNNSISQQMQ